MSMLYQGIRTVLTALGRTLNHWTGFVKGLDKPTYKMEFDERTLAHFPSLPSPVREGDFGPWTWGPGDLADTSARNAYNRSLRTMILRLPR